MIAYTSYIAHLLSCLNNNLIIIIIIIIIISCSSIQCYFILSVLNNRTLRNVNNGQIFIIFPSFPLFNPSLVYRAQILRTCSILPVLRTCVKMSSACSVKDQGEEVNTPTVDTREVSNDPSLPYLANILRTFSLLPVL